MSAWIGWAQQEGLVPEHYGIQETAREPTIASRPGIERNVSSSSNISILALIRRSTTTVPTPMRRSATGHLLPFSPTPVSGVVSYRPFLMIIETVPTISSRRESNY